ncbi:MAG: DUF1573 domain-containing protein [Geobacteraceae bacterium]|nr:DUF1573 domain-containing protein [Geobacteraceae bacterium]
MKLSLTAALVIISLTWGGAALAAPQVAVDRPTHDFGSIGQGQKVEHTFIIRNRGDAPLTIRKVRPACGCTAVTTSASVIAPGRTGEIKATFDSANYSGPVQKTVSLDTDDPKVPSSLLYLKGTVIEEVRINPRQLNLGQVQVGTTKKASLTVTNKGGKPLKLTAVKSSLPQITAESEKKLLKPGESGTIMVSAAPRKGDRLLSGYLSISTDSPAKREITVPVYGSTVN